MCVRCVKFRAEIIWRKFSVALIGTSAVNKSHNGNSESGRESLCFTLQRGARLRNSVSSSETGLTRPLSQLALPARLVVPLPMMGYTFA